MILAILDGSLDAPADVVQRVVRFARRSRYPQGRNNPSDQVRCSLARRAPLTIDANVHSRLAQAYVRMATFLRVALYARASLVGSSVAVVVIANVAAVCVLGFGATLPLAVLTRSCTGRASSPQIQRRKFTPAYKAEVVQLCQQEGESIADVCRRLDLTETAVRRRVAEAVEELAEPSAEASSQLEDDDRKELERLRRENKRLRMEREILKRTTAFFVEESP